MTVDEMLKLELCKISGGNVDTARKFYDFVKEYKRETNAIDIPLKVKMPRTVVKNTKKTAKRKKA